MSEKKTALVTGSTAGIGKAIALRLAGLGCHVLINGRREISAVMPLISEIKSLLVECTYIQGDISHKETRERIIETAGSLGRLDILVNNTGISTRGRKDILSLNEQDMNEVFHVNLIGPMLLTSALVPLMKAREGRSYIINIASISGIVANYPQKQAHYNASKGGVILLTKCLAVEWAGYAIRVNSISPGYTRSEKSISPGHARADMAAMLSTPEMIAQLAQWEAMIPMRRMAEPQEIAGAAIYLASDASSYTTGSNIVVDGGYTAL